jgi:hypothetical protein
MTDEALSTSSPTGTAHEAGSFESDSDIRGEAAAAFAEQSGETASTTPPVDTPSDPSQAPDAARSVDGAEVDETSPLARGPIPYDRHKAVVTNIRNQAEQAEAGWKAKLEPLTWAEKVDRQRAEQALGLLQSLDALADDPQAALAFIARKLGVTQQQLAPQQEQAQDQMPEADIPLEGGGSVYSAAQLQKVLEWRDRQLTRQIDASYGPLKQEAVLSKLHLQARQETGTVLAECRRDWEMFPALEPDIKKLMTDDKSLSLERAYIRAFNGPNGWKKAQAATQQAAEQDRASQLTRKAAAADSVRPGAARPVTPRSDAEKTEREIAAEVFASMSS